MSSKLRNNNWNTKPNWRISNKSNYHQRVTLSQKSLKSQLYWTNKLGKNLRVGRETMIYYSKVRIEVWIYMQKVKLTRLKNLRKLRRKWNMNLMGAHSNQKLKIIINLATRTYWIGIILKDNKISKISLITCTNWQNP